MDEIIRRICFRKGLQIAGPLTTIADRDRAPSGGLHDIQQIARCRGRQQEHVDTNVGG